MGYDVSFHPISPKEMQEWYFAPLAWVQQGQEEKVRSFAAQLLRDLEQNKKVLEATEVVEPNPIAPNESTSYSNLYHCDRDGVYLYIDMAIRQIAQAMGKNTDDR